MSTLGSVLAVLPVSVLVLVSACGGDDAAGSAPVPVPAIPDAAAPETGDGGLPPDGGPTPDGGPPSPFSGFSFGGAVNAAVHAGSSWYIGGDFRSAQVLAAPHLFALDASGAASTGCDLGGGFDGGVSASVVIGSALYVGGEFTHYKGAPANYIAKLDRATCALDTSFSPPASNGFNAPVRALVASGDGGVFVGGLFSRYRGTVSERGIAKLDAASGDLDTTFSPAGADGVDVWVNSLAVSGGALFIGGQFNTYRGAPALSIAKVNVATGALDTTFSPPGDPGVFGEVYALATSGGYVYAGGNFASYRDYSVKNWVKIDVSTGDVDTSTLETPFFDKPVYTLLVSGSSIYVGGAFTRCGIASANGVAKLGLATNMLDTTFSPPGLTRNGVVGPGRVTSLALFDGALYVGGNFARHQYKTTSTPVGHLVKVDPATGVLLSTLTPPGHDLPGVDGDVLTMAPADDTLYVGGMFHGAGGRSVNGLVKVDDTTFEVDTTFSPPGASGFDGPVYALVASGSSLYVGGAFGRYRGVDDSARNLAKLDLATGAIDTTFNAPGPMENGTNGPVHALAIDGNALYVGGGFTAYRYEPEARTGLLKLDLGTGAPDATFSPGGGVTGGTRTVHALALVGTSLFAAGNFTGYSGGAGAPGPANSIVKVDAATGTRDATFSPDNPVENGFTTPFPATVSALAVGNGSLYVGGNFQGYRSVDGISSIAKLDPTSGALDTTFSPATNGFVGEVLALALEGSSVYVGGRLARYRDAFDVVNVAKLDGASGVLDTAFVPSSGPTMEPLGSVQTIVPNGSALLVGGDFGYYGGAKRVASAAVVDAATGALK